MSKIGIFMADGCEEIEGLTVVDIARRAGIEIEMISIMGEREVTSSHNVRFWTDTTKEEADFGKYDGIVLPGGMPGSLNLMQCHRLRNLLISHAGEQGVTAAICAAPFVLGELGLLAGRAATCYPGFEGKLKDALVRTDMVVEDGHFITGRGPAAAIDFAFAIAARFVAPETIAEVRSGMLF